MPFQVSDEIAPANREDVVITNGVPKTLALVIEFPNELAPLEIPRTA